MAFKIKRINIMKLETLKKGITINNDLEREMSIQSKIKKMHTLHKSKKLTKPDIDYLIDRAYEGSNYIINDLKCHLEKLQD